ncbi:hypothetical protein GDO81_005909 [Engystomops pustulosus]|uniref:Uncharacterized protein n=1 Tax=Engystomops pustulosus TaxID=76066 RepID=A0AAV7CUN5_ENGPU|nr:hypothetical protein GDO81_005909 [Engystomops pustulosus]
MWPAALHPPLIMGFILHIILPHIEASCPPSFSTWSLLSSSLFLWPPVSSSRLLKKKKHYYLPFFIPLQQSDFLFSPLPDSDCNLEEGWGHLTEGATYSHNSFRHVRT